MASGAGAREAALLEGEGRRGAAEAPFREFWVRSQELLPELRRWPRPCPPPLVIDTHFCFPIFLAAGWTTARGWRVWSVITLYCTEFEVYYSIRHYCLCTCCLVLKVWNYQWNDSVSMCFYVVCKPSLATMEWDFSNLCLCRPRIHSRTGASLAVAAILFSRWNQCSVSV